MGGEKVWLRPWRSKREGSPPRGRGKAHPGKKSKPGTRITPAWAGKRPLYCLPAIAGRDHPRVGGEKRAKFSTGASSVGSPPRGRGKDTPKIIYEHGKGITPAWAGKSVGPEKGPLFRWDHPRVGGEKLVSYLPPIMAEGSPPRGRGKDFRRFKGLHAVGITPAWAGKRRRCSAFRTLPWDHPRVGGEKLSISQCTKFCEGSPPRGRGKGTDAHKCLGCQGITPAWAGKRLKKSHRSGIFISGPIPFHSVLHRPAGSGGSRAGRDGSPAGQPQNAGPA